MTNMDLSFTPHMANFAEEVHDFQKVEAVVKGQLRRLVVAVLKSMGLYKTAPSLLGYDSQSSGWDKDSEALEQLAWDCYSHAFGKNIHTLSENFAVRGNVDGDVRLHVRNYIRDQQRNTNPIGCAVYDNICESILSLLRIKKVVLEPKGKLNGKSTVCISPDAKCASAEELAGLLEIDAGWNKVFDTSVGESVVTQKGLENLIPDLPKLGISAFKIGELADVATANLKQKLEEFTKDDIQEKAGAEKILMPNRTIKLATRYSRHESEIGLLEKLKASKSKIDSTFRLKKVKERMSLLVDFMIEKLEKGEEVKWPEAAEYVGFTGKKVKRIYDDVERLQMILPKELENQNDG